MSGGGSALSSFGEDIWIASGSPVESFGFRYPTRMAIVRLGNGELFVWSPIALTGELARDVEVLGPVRAIVAPNSLHHLFVPQWARRFPDARLFAAPGLAAKRPDLAFDAELSDMPDSLWQGQIDQSVVRGNLITTEVVFFHRASSTVLVTDLIQQFPRGWFSGWRAAVAWLDGMVTPVPQVPRKFRLAFRDRAAARAALETVFAWPATRLIMAHGAPVSEDASSQIRRAFAWL